MSSSCFSLFSPALNSSTLLIIFLLIFGKHSFGQQRTEVSIEVQLNSNIFRDCIADLILSISYSLFSLMFEASSILPEQSVSGLSSQ